MQIKNISGHDISFMFEAPTSKPEKPIYDTMNIVAGWTVLVSENIWEQIKKQTTTICNMVVEEVEISEGKAIIKGFGGESVTPKRINRIWDGTSKEVNLVEHLIKTRQIEIVESDEAPALPPRPVMETFLKRFGEKVPASMSDEEVAEKVRTLKAELAALDNL